MVRKLGELPMFLVFNSEINSLGNRIVFAFYSRMNSHSPPYGRLIRSFRQEHWAPLHRECPLTMTPPMITLRSGESPIGTMSKRVISSSWWSWMEHLHRTSLADILPSGDRKHLMLEHPATDWPRI
jgi:hypothetical protein